MDNEVKGEGNSINYKYRMHDPRVGRFFAVDPLASKYPWYTPYQFSGNKVIHKVELEGLEESDPPVQVGVNATLRIGMGSKGKLIFNASATFSTQVGTTRPESENFNANARVDLTASVYNGGLGTSRYEKTYGGTNFDVTAAITGTMGAGGKGTPMPQYTLNYNSRSAIDNDYDNSVGYGMLWTYNHAIGKTASANGTSKIPFYRQGIVAFKFGNIAISSNNDDANMGGGNTDEGFTGGIIVSAKFNDLTIEGGYQSFTGANTRGSMAGNSNMRKQSPYQRSLNKASTFARYSYSTPQLSLSSSLDVYTNGWFQDFIHELPGFSGEHLNYDYRGTETGGGIQFGGN